MRVINTKRPEWVAAFTGLSSRQLTKLVPVEHVIDRMKWWKVLRDCRRRGERVRHAAQAVAHLRNLALAG